MACQLVQAGFEPGDDFSASEGHLLCSPEAREHLLGQAPPGWNWYVRYASTVIEPDPIELLEAQVGVPAFFQALVQRGSRTLSKRSDAWAASYVVLLEAYLHARHPYLQSVDLLGALLPSERADAVMDRLERGAIPEFSRAEGEELLERAWLDVLQALGGEAPQHFEPDGKGGVVFTWTGYERLALVLESPEAGPSFLELAAALFEEPSE
ncbi:MAG: hypothetical protein BRC58_02340 [Cyanobacteria bacterium QS_8_64_29]|nr:MAG: hypothetical protein BRC58_02340 [Cyanobacteria bacterium QS_8_64_29]